MTDYTARLAAVQAAITAIVTDGVESYTIEGQSVRRVDLDKLRREERDLLARVARAQRRTGAFSGAVPR